ncbi:MULTISPECIES: sugar ABC transporter substrate-binding protein [unclassified Novosphingobium]|uniref:substrate-binding domain-containing protein n=1 Tax=unclassified Novosphingobium TaxID=2644732 RepID=UPI001469C5AC|nr:ribose transport system substrate-binding protein [Novosphingobium sp. SG919]NMN87196.1 ribose transport system substrate-binding protein [Novosphingobium sp. SG916]
MRPVRPLPLLAAAAIVAVGSLSLVALARHGDAGDTGLAAPPPGAARYALSTVGMSFPFAAAIAKGFRQAAQKAGARAIVLDGKANIQKQANDIDDLIAQRPQGLAIMPLDSIVAQGWVGRAQAARVPVVAVAALVGDPRRRAVTDVYPGLAALVSQDEVATGRAAGDLAADILPAGQTARIAIVEGAAGFPEVEQRTRGFLAGLAARRIPYAIVATQPGNWTPEGGEAVCQNMLAANPRIDLFFNQADDMVIGCARAVRAAGSKARLIGIGGSRLAIASLKAGAINGTVCFQPEALGALAFAAMQRPPAPGTPRFRTYPIHAVTRATASDCTGQW